eukprot:4059627-Prymnesium_polylepis.1
MRAHVASAAVQEEGCVALTNICFGADAAGSGRKQAACDAGALGAVVGGMRAHEASAAVQEQGC